MLVDAVGGCHDHKLRQLVQSTAHARAYSACADNFSFKLLLSMLFTSKSVLVDEVGRCHDHELVQLVSSTAHAQMIYLKICD